VTMLRRIAPLLLALAVAGAPVALELCHIACASLSPQPGGRTGTHARAPHAASCHDAAESAAPLSLHAHACDHGDDLPTPAGVGSARHSKFVPSLIAVIPPTGTSVGTPLDAHTWRRSRSSSRPPARADRILPLRI